MALATPSGTDSRMTISIMNSEPMKAPARPAEAGELRESVLRNSEVLKALRITP